MSNPFFSVIIPALNEELYIDKLLKSLTQQSFKDFEVIVIDAGSTDKTLAIVSGFKKNLNLKIINTKVRNVPLSRNIAARKARGNIFCFIDADNYISSKFLEFSKNYIVDNNYDMIIPKFTPDNNRLSNKILYKLSNAVVSFTLKTPRIYTTGGNIVVNKKYFSKVNGFDPKIFIADDQDFVRRVKKAGAKVKFMSKESVIFATRRFDSEGISAYFKYGYSFIYLLFFPKIEKNIYSYKLGGHNFKK